MLFHEIKNLPANAGGARDAGWIPELGRYPGTGNGNLLQYSCQENPTDREPGRPQSMGVTRVGHDLVMKPPPPPPMSFK